jgi:hypothetical protein
MLLTITTLCAADGACHEDRNLFALEPGMLVAFQCAKVTQDIAVFEYQKGLRLDHIKCRVVEDTEALEALNAHDER